MHADAEFRFSQLSYHVNESTESMSVCLELVNGTLTENVTVEIKSYNNNSTRKEV